MAPLGGTIDEGIYRFTERTTLIGKLDSGAGALDYIDSYWIPASAGTTWVCRSRHFFESRQLLSRRLGLFVGITTGETGPRLRRLSGVGRNPESRISNLVALDRLVPRLSLPAVSPSSRCRRALTTFRRYEVYTTNLLDSGLRRNDGSEVDVILVA